MTKYSKIALSLGGNTGDPVAAFDAAAAALTAAGLRHVCRSSHFRTEPVDCAPGTPPFCNAALTGEWPGSAGELLACCQRLEVEAGRPAEHGFHTPRPLDLDIICFGDEIIRTPVLTVPHPRAQERRFVLQPLAEIAPDMRFADSGLTVREALLRLDGCNQNDFMLY